MRTAIFVYQTTGLDFDTCESNLELSAMSAATVSLSQGQSSRTLAPGIYKIVSDHDVTINGDKSAFDVVVTTQNKDSDPTLPPSRASQNFSPLDLSAMNAFLAVPEAKGNVRV